MEQTKPDKFTYRGGSGIIRLYHGSKKGIRGPIAPKSRKDTDFGEGFYMGTDPQQPKTLVATKKNPTFYELDVRLSGLNCIDIAGLPWAMLVAYNRGEMEKFRGTRMYEEAARITGAYDVIKGPIADDRMYDVLDSFYDNEITDKTLIACMQGLKLGDQYVAKTQRACDTSHIRIVSKTQFTPKELEILKRQADENRKRGYQLTDEFRSQQRADIRAKRDIGRFFEQIIEDEEKERRKRL